MPRGEGCHDRDPQYNNGFRCSPHPVPRRHLKSESLPMRSLRVLCLTAVALMGADAASAASPKVRVDIGANNGRKDALTPHWRDWSVGQRQSIATRVDDVRVEVDALDDGATLQSTLWKAGLADGATVSSDCVFVEGDEAGLRIRIRGLPAGKHSLATFHNSLWDRPTASIDVEVNGAPSIDGLQPSHRVSNDFDAASAYVEFDVAQDELVEVTLRLQPPEQSGDQRLAILPLNGLELDGVDPTARAAKPSPPMDDFHVAPQPTLSWTPAASAHRHDVYLGNEPEVVAAADPQSPSYLGRVTEPTVEVGADDPFKRYFWRVDQIDADGIVTAGDVWEFRIRRLAFPGAQGYGRFAIGGRGGRVLKVTNLNDAGPGSLRAAVEAAGPRTVVFDVSGRIILQNKLVIRNPFLTIAGQTAPAKGICISNFNLGMLGAHDVVVRYLRVRPGDTAGVTLDGMGMASSDHAIIDHCSISWTQDESFSSRGAKNITLQRTLISEALNVAGHKNYEPGKQHGYAASIGGDVGSFHHNLLAHCAGRNWSLAGGVDQANRHAGRLDIRNNVVYNWGHRTTDGGARMVNFVGNYYKPGPASRVFHVLKPEREHIAAFGRQDYYVAGNVMEGRYGPEPALAGVVEPRREPFDDFVFDAPLIPPQMPTQSAEEAYQDVIADVGCNVPQLDEHDQRVLEEVRQGTTAFRGSKSGLPGLPDSQQDVGGWEDYPEVHRPADWDVDGDGMPDVWEHERGLDPGDKLDGTLDRDDDGFTNLEEYLNELVSAH